MLIHSLLMTLLQELWRALRQLSGGEEEDTDGDDDMVVDLEDAVILRDYLAQKLQHLSQYENQVNRVLLSYGVDETRSTKNLTDHRALYLAFYRDGQRRILKETLSELDDLIAQEENGDESS